MKKHSVFVNAFLSLLLLLSFTVTAHDMPLNLKISSVNEFLNFAESVNSGDEAYRHAIVILTRNLDFSDIAYIPVGTAEFPFSGKFDGGGHILSGITISDYEDVYVKVTDTNGQTSRSTSVGVFAYLHNASVYNLGITDMSIDVSASGNDNICAGMLCGSFTADTSGETLDIKCCFAEGNVSVKSSKGSAYAGGLIGRICDSDVQVVFEISDCYADGVVSATAKTTSRCAGIIADLDIKKVFSTAILENLFFAGSLYGKGIMTCIGGICGFASVDNSWGAGEYDWTQEIIPGKIKNVVTDTSITFSTTGSAFVGSVLGYSNTVTPENTYSVNATSNNSYAVGGTEISLSDLADTDFLTQVLKFDMNDIWCIYDEQPVLKSFYVPGYLKITDIMRSDKTVTVMGEYKGFQTEGVVICAAYSEDGRMIDVRMNLLNGDLNFEFDLHSDIKYLRLLLIGDKKLLNPICEGYEYLMYQ